MSAATIPPNHPPMHPAVGRAKAPLRFDSKDLGGQSLRCIESTGLEIRRRPNRTQGRALEMLGHAVEYLVDSRLFMTAESSTPADNEAMQIVMLLCRQVFAECAEIVPIARRLRHWIKERLDTHQTGRFE
jgi:hypothetical protein